MNILWKCNAPPYLLVVGNALVQMPSLSWSRQISFGTPSRAPFPSRCCDFGETVLLFWDCSFLHPGGPLLGWAVHRGYHLNGESPSGNQIVFWGCFNLERLDDVVKRDNPSSAILTVDLLPSLCIHPHLVSPKASSP